MHKQQLHFAVIGCKMLARSQHIPNINRSPKTVLHTCCDLDDAALAECRDRHGAKRVTKDYQAAIDDPEVDADGSGKEAPHGIPKRQRSGHRGRQRRQIVLRPTTPTIVSGTPGYRRRATT